MNQDEEQLQRKLKNFWSSGSFLSQDVPKVVRFPGDPHCSLRKVTMAIISKPTVNE